ncbi:hypothetical protein, partial [Burkholderia sp. Ac-20353]|uniref:hypothetical protein n=1 Tax=Burkholderia sp. Ac-20353 TaxID=2703894 RepID=UPI00197B313F
YRLLIFKERFCEKLGFSAALRFQQQRNEIMNTVSQFVNNFLLHRCDCGVHLPSPAKRLTRHPANFASPSPAPRCR